jgi:23S rRNA (uracil1939-C5)-methyltransferase
MPVTLTITSLGAQGDGIAEHEGRRVFLPFTLPGERVSAEIEGDRAKLVDVLQPSPERHAPRCAHYTVCGGCSLQHMTAAPYLAFKRDIVTGALRQHAIDMAVDPVIPVPPRTRRRAVFAATRQARAGFHGRRSHTIVPITDCAVLTPGLLALLPKLAPIVQLAAPRRDALTLTATETATGIDLALTGAPRDLPADTRLKLSEAALAIGLARLSINGEVAIERTPPMLRAGPAHLTPPPGGFLQACEPSQSEMIRLVGEAIAGSKRIVDLFSGSGTFSLPLAVNAPIHAVESEAAALAALEQAARRTPQLKPVTTEKRDLFRRPLTTEDLKRFDAAVIDPPRAGAEAQSAQLAKSNLKRLAFVSCNAGTFARDLRTLMDGGWKATRITPIDQFLYSPHIEIVAALER